MSNPKRPKLPSPNPNLFVTVADEIRLVLRLMADRRVNPLLKLLPISTLLYFFIPDLVIGPLDDALIIGIGTYLFVELCPPEIVEEHRQAIKNIVDGEAHDVSEKKIPLREDEIIEGEFRDE